MEIEFSSYKWGERERLHFQSALVFFLALGLILWGNLIVFANPSSSSSMGENSRVPLSKRAFDSSGEWRASQKPKSKWRESEEQRMTLQNSRIKTKTSSLYNPSMAHDNWDPYSPTGDGNDMLTKPAKVFEFRF